MDDNAAFQAPKLGIGMIFSSALKPFLQRRPDALDVLEIEPQTLWLADDPFEGPYFEFTPAIDMFAAFPQRKLVHSVGMPIGGTRKPHPAQINLLRSIADRLDSPWVSEHLAIAGTPHKAAGFLLPPLQTDEGVRIASENIRTFAQGMGRPVAIETGVAYFARKGFEMQDGEFVARICEETGCGILLDLHNIYCNEKNGRIPMRDFLAQIPLDRVWEIHLAGGQAMDGYWLDSHSGEMPDDLAAFSREVVQSLPNLGALNFEIYDTFLERLPPEELDRTIDALRAIWEQAGVSRSDAPPHVPPSRPTIDEPAPTSAVWEDGATRAVWQDDPSQHDWPEDTAALRLYSRLARSFRGSMLVRAMPRSLRYLLLRDGGGAETLLSRFHTAHDPRLFTPLEAQSFADFVIAQGELDPWLLALMDYDLAFLNIVRQGKAQLIRFPGDPTILFEGLAAAQLPDDLPDNPPWEIELLPDGFTVADFTRTPAAS